MVYLLTLISPQPTPALPSQKPHYLQIPSPPRPPPTPKKQTQTITAHSATVHPVSFPKFVPETCSPTTCNVANLAPYTGGSNVTSVVFDAYRLITSLSVALYGLERVTFWVEVAIRALALLESVVAESLWKNTRKLVGGDCAQSKWKPLIKALPASARSTVREAVVLAESGCHFVLTPPSKAEKGNWPGWKLSADTAGRHWAMLPSVAMFAAICRLGKVRVLFGLSWYVVWLLAVDEPIWTEMAEVA